MKLEAIKAELPSRKLSNTDIVELIRRRSRKTFKGNLDRALKQIHALLKQSGANYRFWLGKEETPIELLSRAVINALEAANRKKEDIDLLVYVGVDRGFLEPGGAHFVAHALEMRRVHCFDLLDSCMSWARAVHLIHALLRAGIYNRAMIVNGEFNQTHPHGAGYPVMFSLENEEQIEWTFPGFTVGEAATAAIFSRSDDRLWEFHFSSRNDLADLCTIPTYGYQQYALPSRYTGRNGPNRFTSFGVRMHEEGKKEVVAIFQKLEAPRREIRWIFPHASSKAAWHDAGKRLGVESFLYQIYSDYGNLVSASIPTGISVAISKNELERGERVVGWAGSAGMSFAVFSFIY